jgi:hypothetical protein
MGLHDTEDDAEQRILVSFWLAASNNAVSFLPDMATLQ